MANTPYDPSGGGKKKRKTPKMPGNYNPFAIYNPYASQAPYAPPFATAVPTTFQSPGIPYAYNPRITTTPGYQGAYGPSAQGIATTPAGGIEKPKAVTSAGDYGKWYSAEGQGRGGAGWFGGVPGVNRAGEDVLYGYGWGNANLVYNAGTEDDPYYVPSYYGEDSFGLTELNVDKGTGEIKGSLNEYGQPIGTQAPYQSTGARRGGRWRAPGLTDEQVYWRNRQLGKIGPQIKGLQEKRRQAANEQRGGGKSRSPEATSPKQNEAGTSAYAPNWYNDLINWNI